MTKTTIPFTFSHLKSENPEKEVLHDQICYCEKMCVRTPFGFRSRNAYTGSHKISLPVIFKVS